MPVAAARARAFGRLAVAIGIASVVAGLVWAARPTGLQPPIDIVGFPTFANYDYRRPFLLYRLVMWVLPLTTLAFWWLLGRVGPFAVPPRPRRAVALAEAPSDVTAARAKDPSDQFTLWRYGRIVPTAAVVAVVVSAGPGGDPARQLSVVGVLSGLAAMVVIVGAATLLARGGQQSRHVGGKHSDPALAVVHAFAAATVCVWALVWHLRQSAVRLLADDALVRYPWVPWWGGALAWLLAMVTLVFGIQRLSPARVERLVVQFIVGSVLVYLLTSHMAAQVGPIQGFDDMQSVTGADLLSRGHFPWSEFLFIHGLFEDALRSTAGFALFGHTMWATNAALGLVWIPLTWLGVYWLGVWASRGRGGPVVAVGLLVVWGSVAIPLSFRWVAMSLVWLLLGQSVRNSRWPWTALMTAVLFLEAVLVPEASFQVIGVTAVLVASDLYHRGEGASRWRSLVRTRVFVLAGISCAVVWCGFLATQGAFADFVGYYLVFGPGHAESGALQVPDLASRKVLAMFVVAIGAAAATMWVTVAALVARRPLGSPQWVALGVAMTTGLYAEKGLGRFDDPHLLQVVTVSLPMLAIWAVALLRRLDHMIHRKGDGAVLSAVDRPPADRLTDVQPRTRLPAGWRQPVSSVAIILLLAVPSVHRAAQAAPGNNAADVGGNRVPGLGWSADDAVATTTLRDLRKILGRYLRAGPVFDFTNSPGYFYFLLGADPPTSFFHVSMAIPEFSQEIVIDQLEDTRPALVVFDAPFGLPSWDGVHNEIRHYTLSQYLLDGWTPLLRSNGVLFLVRNDLLDDAPEPPRLTGPVEGNDLWFAGPACDWGSAANFLTSEPTGERVTLDLPAPVASRRVAFAGWAYDADAKRAVGQIALAVDGEIAATVPANIPRLDIEAKFGSTEAAASGFSGVADIKRAAPEPELYAVDRDGVAHSLAGSPPREPRDSLSRPGGDPIRVSPVPVPGAVDALVQEDVDVSTINLPDGLYLPSFRLAELSSTAGDLGNGQVEITPPFENLAGRDQRILARTLPQTGRSLRVRVGSCLQWHGYNGDTLYLTQRGLAHPVDRMVLSDVSRPFEK